MVVHHWLCGSSAPLSWARSAPCGCPGASFMLWTLWCLRQKRTRSRAVTWAASSGLTLLWLHPLSPPSSAPSQGRNPSYRRLRCSTTDLWQPANLPSGSLTLSSLSPVSCSSLSHFASIASPPFVPSSSISLFLPLFFPFFVLQPSVEAWPPLLPLCLIPPNPSLLSTPLFVFQVLHEQIEVPGTSLKLCYLSSRTQGYRSLLKVTMTPAVVSMGLLKVHLMVAVEGHLFQKWFHASPNLAYTYIWDKTDAYGQRVYGLSEAVGEWKG